MVMNISNKLERLEKKLSDKTKTKLIFVVEEEDGIYKLNGKEYTENELEKIREDYRRKGISLRYIIVKLVKTDTR